MSMSAFPASDECPVSLWAIAWGVAAALRQRAGRPVQPRSARIPAGPGPGSGRASSNWLSPSSDRARSLGPCYLLGTATGAVATGLTLRTRRMSSTVREDRAASLETERAQRVRLTAAMGRSRAAREMRDIVGLNLSVTVGR
jgi:hypothetical protein